VTLDVLVSFRGPPISSARVEQHPNTDGHYVVVVEGAEGFVFETDGRRVLQFRGGTADAVRYTEYCQ
jgi:hypothetical protein